MVDPALGTLARAVNKRSGIPNAQEISAAKDILDRAGLKPVEKSQVSLQWNGDVSTLDDDGLARLANYLEQVAFGQDRARMLEEKRRALTTAGVAPDVIEAEFEEMPESIVDEGEGW